MVDSNQTALGWCCPLVAGIKHGRLGSPISLLKELRALCATSLQQSGVLSLKPSPPLQVRPLLTYTHVLLPPAPPPQLPPSYLKGKLSPFLSCLYFILHFVLG